MSDVDSNLKLEVQRLSEAVATLRDGKWEWHKDLMAIATVVSAVGGLAIGGVALLMQLGILG